MGLIIFSRGNFGVILESCSWSKATMIVTSSIVFYIFGHVIYNIYFHPLAKFPGPKFAAISNIFYARTVVTGASVKTMKALHEKYGDVVRWAPNELSFSSAEAWKDIYAPHKPGEVFVKDPTFYIIDDELRAKQIANISDPEEHEQARKMWGPAFSTKALTKQQDIVLKYANMLMDAIRAESRKGPINLVDYYNWVTSDVLGELAFSESFGSVANRKTNSWIATLLDTVKFGAYDCAIHRLSPLIWKKMHLFIPAHITEAATNHVIQSKAKLLARMEKSANLSRQDFCSYLIEKKDELGLSDWELAGYANTLIMAGSETTATLFCGLTYYLCRNGEVYGRLKEEVRCRFKSADEITSHSATFPYLTAVINEAFRIYPPVPIALPRVTPKGGAIVAGVFVPEGTIVGVHMWCVTHNPKYFKDPDAFRPDRWLDPDCTDSLSASQPFLLGSRNCIGQNMALMELRILVAKMVFLFNFKLVDDDLDWDRDAKCYRLWQKPPLWTDVTIREL